MSSEHSILSCGIRELYDLEDSPEELIRGLLENEMRSRSDPLIFSQVIFSDNITEGNRKLKECNGERLAKFIRDNKLGILIETRPIKNRNTGNKIKTWIWNITNVRKLYKAAGRKKPKEDYGYLW